MFTWDKYSDFFTILQPMPAPPAGYNSDPEVMSSFFFIPSIQAHDAQLSIRNYVASVPAALTSYYWKE